MKVYMTYRNQDTTEGRGPMVPSLCFLHREHAEAYIDEQPGVMGLRRRWSTDKYGDWRVVEVEVIERDIIDAKKKREELKASVLKKLTPEELEVLGY